MKGDIKHKHIMKQRDGQSTELGGSTARIIVTIWSTICEVVLKVWYCHSETNCNFKQAPALAQVDPKFSLKQYYSKKYQLIIFPSPLQRVSLRIIHKGLLKTGSLFSSFLKHYSCTTSLIQMLRFDKILWMQLLNALYLSKNLRVATLIFWYPGRKRVQTNN